MSELTPETRAFLEARRQAAPALSEAKRAALKSSVLGHVASGTAPLAAVAIGKGTLAFLGVASIALVAVGGAAIWATGAKVTAHPPQASGEAASAGAPAPAAPPAQVGDAARMEEPSAGNAPAAPSLVEPPQLPEARPDIPPSAEPRSGSTKAAPHFGARAATTAAVTAAPATATAAGATGPPAAATAATTAAVTPTAATTAPQAQATAPQATATTAPPPPLAPPTTAASLDEETRLVRGAASARKAGEPARALALLDAHASRFPHGVLERERRAERVFALCDAARTAELAPRPRRCFVTTLAARSPIESVRRAVCGEERRGARRPSPRARQSRGARRRGQRGVHRLRVG